MHISKLLSFLILGLLFSIKSFSQDNYNIISKLSSGPTRTMDVENNIIYFNKGEHSIQALEINSSNEFMNHGEYNIDKMGSIQQLVVYNKFVFVAMEYEGLVIIDFNDPMAPEIIGNFKPYLDDHSINIKYLLKKEHYLFVSNENELCVLDIDNPYEYKLLTIYKEFGKKIGGLKSVDNYLYILGYWSGDGYEILDTSNPVQPIKLISKELQFTDIAFFNNKMYITKGYNGFDVYDNSLPTYPTKIASYNSGNGSLFIGEINLLNDKYLYLSANTSGPTNVYLFDVNSLNNIINLGVISWDPLNFVLHNDLLIAYDGRQIAPGPIKLYKSDDLTTLTPINSYYSRSSYQSITLSQNYIYASDYLSGYLRIINFNNPYHLFETDYVRLFDKYTLASLSSVNNTIYALGYKQIRILDASMLDKPKLIGSLFLSLEANKIYIYDTLAFAVGKDGFEIISLNDSQNIKRIGVFRNPNTKDILVIGNYLYLADGSVKLIDISNLKSPVEIEQFLSISDKVNSLAVFEDKIYACSEDRVLYIFEASDPINTSLLKKNEYYNEDGVWSNIKIHEQYAFITLQNGQLSIYSLHDRLFPQVITKIYFDNNITDIIFSNENILCSDNWGITVLKNESTSTIDKQNNELPNNFSLFQNYPNPFNPITRIQFEIPQSEKVTLKVYNTLGQQAAILIDGEEMQPGNHEEIFDASRFNLTSGLYVYRLTAGNVVISKKMILLK